MTSISLHVRRANMVSPSHTLTLRRRISSGHTGYMTRAFPWFATGIYEGVREGFARRITWEMWCGRHRAHNSLFCTGSPTPEIPRTTGMSESNNSHSMRRRNAVRDGFNESHIVGSTLSRVILTSTRLDYPFFSVCSFP